MQSIFLIESKQYSEKEVGLMFFAFGIGQFIFQMPAGYLIDYLEHKRMLLGIAAIFTTLLTLATAVFASDDGGNLELMIIIKFIQGGITSLIPPCLNSITQGIVGSVGMTDQVAKNEMMHHWGTALLVMAASLMGYVLYPHLEALFFVSPIACIGVIYQLRKIKARYICHSAARGLIETPVMSIKSTTSENDFLDLDSDYRIRFQPSFYCGCKSYSSDWDDIHSPRKSSQNVPKANSPLRIMRDRKLVSFLIICFTFNLANGTVLPLVMQTLAIDNGGAGILMSGSCIAIAQIFMEFSAEFCGEYSSVYGRKTIFISGIMTLCSRCVILAILLEFKDNENLSIPDLVIDLLILSTQILDGIGAGIFGTMSILVTCDLSIGTGRFSWMIGLTTAAISLGGTVSGYVGQALAQDYGYRDAFICLGLISLIPVLFYAFGVPETFLGEEEGEMKKDNNQHSPTGRCGSIADSSDYSLKPPEITDVAKGTNTDALTNLHADYKKEVQLLFEESRGTKRHYKKENSLVM